MNSAYSDVNLGWEKAENEVGHLKQQLGTTVQQKSALEDRVNHLDGALKECVRQLRQAREEQEQKIHDAVEEKPEIGSPPSWILRGSCFCSRAKQMLLNVNLL